MKLILAIISSEDTKACVAALTKERFQVTTKKTAQESPGALAMG